MIRDFDGFNLEVSSFDLMKNVLPSGAIGKNYSKKITFIHIFFPALSLNPWVAQDFLKLVFKALSILVFGKLVENMRAPQDYSNRCFSDQLWPEPLFFSLVCHFLGSFKHSSYVKILRSLSLKLASISLFSLFHWTRPFAPDPTKLSFSFCIPS